MKRRSFTFGLAALAAAPTLPLATASSAAPGITAQQFSLAKLLARAHNHCTPEMLARHMKLTPDAARNVQAVLLRNGVITPPVAGVSMATNPMNTNCVPKEALKPTNIAKSVTETRNRLREILRPREDEVEHEDAPQHTEIEQVSDMTEGEDHPEDPSNAEQIGPEKPPLSQS